jgi:hypothetical protein
MLTSDTVTKRAITWYAIAQVTLSKNGSMQASGCFSKASAYLDVLNLPYHKCCGKKCAENLREYAEKLAFDFMKSGDVCVNTYLGDNIDINKYFE